MGSSRPLLGREDESRQVAAMLGSARNGRGGALLLTGDPGIGKTTLLDASTDVPGMRLVRLDGFEAEAEMPFAAIQRLSLSLRDFLPALPDREQQALRVASGHAEGPPPDRFLVGLGVLGLLATAGEQRPVVCAVDDAHLLDSESLDVMAFVARRVEAESAALMFAARDTPHVVTQMAGVPALHLDGLGAESAMKLLTLSLPAPIDPAIAVQVAAATGGNPLALTDLARELSVRQLTESSFGEEPFPVGRHLESFYLRRVRRLGEQLQTWLLVAAADSTGNVGLVTQAATELGLPDGAGDAAEAAGLVALGATLQFRHPLVRAAAYNAATGRERRRVHRALSVAADFQDMPGRGAWHAAKATLGTDEEVAARLEKVGDQAGQRGGYASRANVMAQASALTPAGKGKYRRLVAAAEAALAAGTSQLAKDLLDDVDDDELDDVSHGRLVVLGAQLALFTADPALTRASRDLLRAAALFHGHDDALEQRTLIKAWELALPAERLVEDVAWDELGKRLAAGADLRPGTASTILRGLSAHLLLPYAQAVPAMREAVDLIADLPPAELLEYGHSSVALTTALWDEQARRRCLERWANAARDAGSLQQLDNALWVLSLSETVVGNARGATEYIDQVRELRRAIGYDAEHVVNVALLAWTGVPRDQVVAMATGINTMGLGGVYSSAMAAVAAMDLGRSDFETAYTTLEPFIDNVFWHTTPLTYPDFIEAAARTGRPEEAWRALERLDERAVASGSPWAQGVAARALALLTDGDAAEEHYQAAVKLLGASTVESELGRAHLVYGEWLRRAKRRRDAKRELRTAADIFGRVSAGSFLDRANHELEALGEAPATPRPEADLGLTAQEATVAKLAAAGNTNAEIGSTMFISANTVDYHLRKVFAKLGISSRRQLSDRLGVPHR